MRACTFVSVVVCVARKLRPCPSYSGRRDRNNSVHWCSLYKGGGVPVCIVFGKAKFDFPPAKKWAKNFFGVGGCQGQRPPPPHSKHE